MKFVSPLSTTSSVDFSAASSTKPNKTGTTLPETCAVGDTFIDTDATAGQNFYVCLSENVWTLQGGGGSDAVTAAGTLTSSAPVIGSGSKAVAVGSRSGNTTEFATISGTKTASKQATFDASGNIIASAYDVGSAEGGGNVSTAATLTSGLPVVGAGGSSIGIGTRSGNTTEYATSTGTKTTGKQLQWDANGNVSASASDIGGGTGDVTGVSTLTLGLPVIGAGDKNVGVGTRSGNTTEYATVTGTKTVDKQLKFDASGNVVASSTDIGGSGTSGMTLLHSTVNSDVEGTGAAQTLASYTITAGTLQAGDTVRVEAYLLRTSGSNGDAQPMMAMGNGGSPVYGYTIGTPGDAMYYADWTVRTSTTVALNGMLWRTPESSSVMLPKSAGDKYTVPSDFDIAENNVVAIKTSGGYIAVGTTVTVVYFRVWRIR